MLDERERERGRKREKYGARERERERVNCSISCFSPRVPSMDVQNDEPGL